jgi:predicted HTH transcriptional regulator
MTNEGLLILLSELRSLPNETEWVEFKTNNWSDLGEYVSALANSSYIQEKEYGYIVFGIDDLTHRIIGTNFNPYQKAKGNEDLIPWIARLLEPKVHFEHFIFDAEGERIVIFRIRSANGIPVKFSGEAFIRIGSYKKKLLAHPEKEKLIWTKEPSSSFELGIAYFDASADDVLRLIDYPSYFELIGLSLPDNRLAIFEKLKQEKIILVKGQKYDITNLGAILFARELEAFELVKRSAIRVIIYQGKTKFKTKKEQEGKRGYATGFKGLVTYINDQLPNDEVTGKIFRKEVRKFPQLAIRELVANAIIHQDFSEKGTGPMIEIFDDRIEITNPGKPLINTMRFMDHNPQSRNEKLAHFMRRLNICEERGSGIDKVIFECESYQLPAPTFYEGNNYTRVTLFAHKSLRQMNIEDKIRACYLHASLKYISGDFMTNSSLRERFGIAEKNYSIASRIISEGIKSGLIKDQDPYNKSKKHSRYVPFWA